MVYPDLAEVLVAVRIIAVIVFLDLYIQDRRPQNLVLTGAWFLFFLAAAARFLWASYPVAGPNVAGVLGIGATVMVGMAAIAVVDERFHRPTAPVFWITILAGLGAVLLPWKIDPALLLTVQGIVLVAYIRVLTQRKVLIPELRKARHALALVLVVSVGQIALMATHLLTPRMGTLGTTASSILVMLFFVYADQARTIAEMSRNERRLARAEKITPMGYWHRDTSTNQVTWSPGHYEIFRIPPGEGPLTLKGYLEYVHPRDRQKVASLFKDVEPGGISPTIEYRITRRDGTSAWLSAEFIREENGTEYFGIIHDITRRKESELKLEQALEEKTVLLREVHHRVKNNMQVILSLLQLKLRGVISDPYATNVLEDVERRIRSMALVHDQLLSTDNLADIALHQYLPEIGRQVFATFRTPEQATRIEFSVEPISLAADTALACGLILAELVANACRHAFVPADPDADSDDSEPKHTDQLITVSFHRRHDSFVLSVRDNGVGISATEGHHPAPLGLEFVRTFVSQIQGELSIHHQGGTTISIHIPVSPDFCYIQVP